MQRDVDLIRSQLLRFGLAPKVDAALPETQGQRGDQTGEDHHVALQHPWDMGKKHGKNHGENVEKKRGKTWKHIEKT